VTGHMVLVLASSLLIGFDGEEAKKKEYARFEGTWSFALVEVDGTKRPSGPFATHKIIIGKEGRFIVVQGPRVTRGSFKLDPTQTPRHFDNTAIGPSGKSQTSPGIYELDEDTYKVCFSLSGKERPTVLGSKPGSGLIYFVMKREKQEVKEAMLEAGRLEMAGTWQAVSYALNGEKASEEDLMKIKLIFDANGKAMALRDGKVFLASTTKIDPTKTPMTVDIVYTEGDLKDKTSHGIYKIEGDLLTICRAPQDKARPTEFSSKPGSGLTLMTYQREKATQK
jgi:uncharacterized protein (TIGR03067 family)